MKSSKLVKGLGMTTIDDPPELKEVGNVLDNDAKLRLKQTPEYTGSF